MYEFKTYTLSEIDSMIESLLAKYTCQYPEGNCDCTRTETNCSSVSSRVVKNDKDEAVVEIDLPGYKKEEISVKVEGKYLVTSVDGKRGKKSIKRLLTDSADVSKISAKFEDGILTIIVPTKPTVEIKIL